MAGKRCVRKRKETESRCLYQSEWQSHPVNWLPVILNHQSRRFFRSVRSASRRDRMTSKCLKTSMKSMNNRSACPMLILVPHPSLFDDERRVVADESTHDKETGIEIDGEEERGPDEQVHEGQQHERGEQWHQSTAQIQVLPLVRKDRADGEAQEDDRCRDQCGRNDRRGHQHRKVQQWSSGQAGAECTAHQVPHPLVPALCVVRCRVQCDREFPVTPVMTAGRRTAVPCTGARMLPVPRPAGPVTSCRTPASMCFHRRLPVHGKRSRSACKRYTSG